jgi:dipeptidyl aminopeptidase/acylaminoacyl peptidase
MRVWGFVAGIAASVLCASAYAQDGPPPVEAYGHLPAVQSAAISPDGTRLIVSIANAQTTALRLFNLSSGRAETTLAPPIENKFRGVGWANNGQAVYYISRALRPHQALPWGYRFRGNPGHVEYWRVGVLDIATVRARLLMNDEHAFANTNLTNLIAPIDGDDGYGRMIAFAGVGIGNLTEDNPQLSVFRVNLARGTALAQTVGNLDTEDFALNQRGEAVARMDVDDKSGEWRLIAYGAGGEHVLRQGVTETGSPPDLLAQMQDGRIAIYNRSDDGEKDALLAVDPATNASEELRAPGDINPRGVVTDPWTHLGVGLYWDDDFPRQYFFDPALRELDETLGAQFADGYAEIMSWSTDKSRMLVLGEHADDGGGYYIFEAASKRLIRVGQLYPELANEAALGERSAITYPARDGARVPAYLTLPAGVDHHNLPLVLLVHGGPHYRDNFQFDWWASFLASRGYAVLQANFRGSTGYGFDWFDAGRGQWGDGVMQSDVEDGVDALVRTGMVDPKRVCIMGASYGGYSALIGAALSPDKFACAVSVAGVSDILAMLDATATRTGAQSLASDWWRTSVGDRRNDRDHLRAISPISHAADFRAPVLLIHGEDDTVVPINQSQHMADRLHSAGKSVRLVTLQGDDHWLSEPETRVQMLREIETFLAQNIGAAPIDAPAAPR